MIRRQAEGEVRWLLEHTPAVVITGPRQAGKTTLALEIAKTRPSTYLDLESEADRAKLAEIELYFADHERELVVLDEVQRVPGLFETLRGVIDRGRREGRGSGRFLLAGSASIDLLAQSGETLAGRVAFVELGPLGAAEIEAGQLDRLWIRGGFPESFLAPGGATSSGPTWSDTSRSWARGSPQRPCGACGRCWRTARAARSTPRSLPLAWAWTARRSAGTST